MKLFERSFFQQFLKIFKMSVVKKPAFASTCFNITSSGNSSEVPSPSSNLKAQITSLYFQERFSQLLNSQQMREQQRQEIISSGLPQEELEQKLKEFDEKQSGAARLSRARIKPDRFQRIALIGKGGFGSIWLVNDSQTGNKYALKVLRKADIIQTEQIANVRTERDVLARSNTPWIANLEFSFQDSNYLYLVLEFIQGGDLMNLLIKRSILSENEAKFYCGEIALALNFIHQRGLVHLDLKPDNILICSSGHLKLTDFGLATYFRKTDGRFQNLVSQIQNYIIDPDRPLNDKRHHDRTTLITTCDYTAPEILLQNPADASADWWSFGVILYEMIFGYTPFYANTPQQTAFNVLQWQKTLRFPTGRPVSKEVRELLVHLLCPAESRWGFEQVSKCAFFNNSRSSRPFDFVNPENNIPPLVPALKSPVDTSFFDPIVLSEDPLPEIPISEELAKFAFLGYTYKKDQHC